MNAVVRATPTIRLLGPGDAAVLRDVAEDVLDNEISPRWTAEFLSVTPHPCDALPGFPSRYLSRRQQLSVSSALA
jgi:hypothetical protein